ncbi:hypothetical protein, partial [Mycobacterium riyadhense]
ASVVRRVSAGLVGLRAASVPAVPAVSAGLVGPVEVVLMRWSVRARLVVLGLLAVPVVRVVRVAIAALVVSMAPAVRAVSEVPAAKVVLVDRAPTPTGVTVVLVVRAGRPASVVRRVSAGLV